MCLNIGVVALRSYMKDTGNEASVGSETFLTLSILSVYLREKSKDCLIAKSFPVPRQIFSCMQNS